MSTVLNPSQLVGRDNIPGNTYAYYLNLEKPWIMSKGAMIAYYGQMQFTALMQGLRAGMLGHLAGTVSAPMYMGNFVIAQGQGVLIIGDRGYDINSYDLDAGNLTIRAANLLAFEPGLELKQSIVPGFLTLLGTGTFLASSNGPVMFAEPPLRVDPQALVGWADCPSPSHHYDQNWINGFMAAGAAMMGAGSGEEQQFDFTGAGTVLIQSTEKIINDVDIVRTIEAQIPGLSQAGLQSVIARARANLQQQQ
ncbi:AIM24 family protein [Williamsia sp. CHRR-6]|uniref:AIM24 family protein n=1 Tax=Williamsia sp. CHRR-6 TaxID=2835871 RepID=UPI001BDA2990|nr:AIM24 family protein [Williamsia sp. CHRR-6]MBT0567198.1 AIM24 family protein [Williamsia sp. CHRR-6]